MMLKLNVCSNSKLWHWCYSNLMTYELDQVQKLYVLFSYHLSYFFILRKYFLIKIIVTLFYFFIQMSIRFTEECFRKLPNQIWLKNLSWLSLSKKELNHISLGILPYKSQRQNAVDIRPKSSYLLKCFSLYHECRF